MWLKEAKLELLLGYIGGNKMEMKKIITKHSHSIITAGFIIPACLLGFGLYALIYLAGYWFGREHSQAEYRYMKLKGINRSKLAFFDGFRLEAWDRDSFLNDLTIPIMVGLLTICIQILFSIYSL